MQKFVINKTDDYRLLTGRTPSLNPGDVLIQMAAVGICGSDIHYFKSGACGDFKICEPFVPGHEASGYIETLGEGVEGLREGDLVAINPSLPCGTCAMCASARPNLCMNNGFMGSASQFPHRQGMMSEKFVVRAEQCFVVPRQTDSAALAMAEPLSVALHAVSRSAVVAGKRALVIGGGPIGLLIALALRHAGAAEVQISDTTEHARAVAAKLGFTQTHNPRSHPDGLATATGPVDTVFEASGSLSGLKDGIEAAAPGGTVVQVGTLPPIATEVPINSIMAKELNYHGAFRFDVEFSQAVELIVSSALDLTPMISAQFPIARAEEAFRLALDPNVSTKVQVVP